MKRGWIGVGVFVHAERQVRNAKEQTRTLQSLPWDFGPCPIV